MSFIININDICSIKYQVFLNQDNIDQSYNFRSTQSFNFEYIDDNDIMR